MHDLRPTTALSTARAVREVIGGLTLSEIEGLSLTSVMERRGHGDACRDTLAATVGTVPAPGRASLGGTKTAYWMGPGQWMVMTTATAEGDALDHLKSAFGPSASLTDQSGAWVCLEIESPALPDLCERLCAVPIRRMRPGDATRTLIHQIGCFLIRMDPDHVIRILGPRSSARSLVDAVRTAARSVA